jgi:hypothetical protein
LQNFGFEFIGLILGPIEAIVRTIHRQLPCEVRPNQSWWSIEFCSDKRCIGTKAEISGMIRAAVDPRGNLTP